ncbi:MAG: hypothetical protein H6834_09070 [Planctomycetes bacterium]|nr:hypothetical protein [Planctomycetota bacterium]
MRTTPCRWYVPIPNQPWLLGAEAFAQAWVLDSAGAFTNVASATAGLWLMIGS